jgi:hypothetical protein
MLRTEPHDNDFLVGKLTASQLLARFAGVGGPDLHDPASVHKRGPLASWDYPHSRGGANCDANRVPVGRPLSSP